MKLQLFEYRCEPYGHAFHAPELPLGTYGEFILRDDSATSMSYLNAVTDITYKEVDALLESQFGAIGMKAKKRAEILRKIYGPVACDPTPEGNPFRIGQHPRCPVCSTFFMRSWQEVQPVQYVELDVPSVTHLCWQALTYEQKFARINEYVSKHMK